MFKASSSSIFSDHSGILGRCFICNDQPCRRHDAILGNPQTTRVALRNHESSDYEAVATVSTSYISFSCAASNNEGH